MQCRFFMECKQEVIDLLTVAVPAVSDVAADRNYEIVLPRIRFAKADEFNVANFQKMSDWIQTKEKRKTVRHYSVIKITQTIEIDRFRLEGGKVALGIAADNFFRDALNDLDTTNNRNICGYIENVPVIARLNYSGTVFMTNDGDKYLLDYPYSSQLLWALYEHRYFVMKALSLNGNCSFKDN